MKPFPLLHWEERVRERRLPAASASGAASSPSPSSHWSSGISGWGGGLVGRYSPAGRRATSGPRPLASALIGTRAMFLSARLGSQAPSAWIVAS